MAHPFVGEEQCKGTVAGNCRGVREITYRGGSSEVDAVLGRRRLVTVIFCCNSDGEGVMVIFSWSAD
jgi:hypothetical protein